MPERVENRRMSENPYKDVNGKPQLVNSVVAYIDILGYSDYVNECFTKGNGLEELNRLLNAMEVAMVYLKNRSIPNGFTKDLYIRSLTDCIFIGFPCPIECQMEEKIEEIIYYIASLQAALILDGYFIRGAITVGEVYIDEETVFGSSVVKAVEAEEKRAVYPRVLICDEAKQYFSMGVDEGAHSLLIDSDNEVFIDYLQAEVMRFSPPYTDVLNANKNHVITNLASHSKNLKVLRKYQWAANYHNTFCETNKSTLSDSYNIPLNINLPKPKLWIKS